MDCRDVAKSMDAYWDRELPADQSARIQAHLGQCSACHEGFGRLDEWLSSPDPIVVPSGLRDRVLAAVLEAVDRADPGSGIGLAPVQEPCGTGVPPVLRGRDARVTAAGGTPVPHRTAAQAGSRHYHLIPFAWAGALAACIALLFVSRPPPPRMVEPVAAAPDPVMIPSLIAAVLQPSPLAAAGAVMAQAAALEQVNQKRLEPPPPLRTGRRPLWVDWVPPDTDVSVQQLPAIISAVSPLGA